jgi:Tol biopolymer transport system component
MQNTTRKYLLLACAATLVAAPNADARSRTRKARRAKTVAAKRPAKAPQVKITPVFLRGKIAYIQSGDLWVMDGAGRGRVKVLAQPFGWGSMGAVAFSPDLKHIAYSYAPMSKSGGRVETGSELFRVNVDGSGRKRLTDTKFADSAGEPRWSPDGRRILYRRGTGYRMGGPGYSGAELRIVDADGSNDRAVVGSIQNAGQSQWGAFWSRDGQRLLFTHYTGNPDYNGDDGGRPELKVSNADGSNVLPFDNNYAPWDRPDVSPDGTARAVVEITKSPSYLELRESAGVGLAKNMLLYSADLKPSNPHWSADGKHVAFQAEQHYIRVAPDGAAHSYDATGIWRVNTDGTGLRRLTENATLVAWLR